MAECNRTNSQDILTLKKQVANSLNCNPTQGERCGKNKMQAN